MAVNQVSATSITDQKWIFIQSIIESIEQAGHKSDDWRSLPAIARQIPDRLPRQSSNQPMTGADITIRSKNQHSVRPKGDDSMKRSSGCRVYFFVSECSGRGTMKLQQLKYLLAIVDNGLNITAAAERLYTSQPGVSKQLKLLEEELGVKLFVRKGKSLSGITLAGHQVISRARAIMREVEEIRVVTARQFRDQGSRSSMPAEHQRIG